MLICERTSSAARRKSADWRSPLKAKRGSARMGPDLPGRGGVVAVEPARKAPTQAKNQARERLHPRTLEKVKQEQDSRFSRGSLNDGGSARTDARTPDIDTLGHHFWALRHALSRRERECHSRRQAPFAERSRIHRSEKGFIKSEQENFRMMSFTGCSWTSKL